MPFLNRIGSGSTSKFGFSKGFLPGAPTSVTASLPNTYGNTTATVSWTAPLVVGAPALDDYQIQYSSDNGSTYTTFADAVSNATTVTVTGLTNGFAYVFRVAAINQIGTGDFSAASNSVTPLDSKIPTPLFTMDDDTQGRVGIDFSNYLGDANVAQSYEAFPGGKYFYNYFDCGGGICPNDTSGTSHGWIGLNPDTTRSAFLKVQRFGYADSDTVFCSETSPSAPNPCAGSPAAGTVLSGNYCSGTTLVRNVSDGCNGTTVQTVEANSATCGYNPCSSVDCNTLNQSPPPGNENIWTYSASVNLAWSTSACSSAGYGGLSSECVPASGYSLWYVYYSANNCCVYNLFSGYCGCDPQLGEMA